MPSELRWFLGVYGAGPFALTVIYSVIGDGPDSVAYAMDQPWIDENTFFPIADNGAGDYYGFRIDSQRSLGSAVLVLDHETGSVRDHPAYSTLFDFLRVVALGANGNGNER